MIMIPLKGGVGGSANPGTAASNNTSINNNQPTLTQQSQIEATVTAGGTGILSQQQQQQLLSLSGQQQQARKNTSKQRHQQNPQQMFIGHGANSQSLSSSSQNIQQQRQQEVNNQAALKAAAAAAAQLMHNQTAKIPQSLLMGGGPNSQNSNYNSLQAPSAAQVMKGLLMAPISSSANEKPATSQKKRVGVKKTDVDGGGDTKTIEQQLQMQSPNSSTLNLENMKKAQSLLYAPRDNGSGANSPQQQMKSRTSIGRYQNPASVLGMAAYNNYNNVPLSNGQTQPGSQQRGALITGALNGIPLTLPGSAQGSAGGPGNLSVGNRSRSKTSTNRKKRNLYTSVGNYYQSQQQTNASQLPQGQASAVNSASRASKRLNNQQNYPENFEQTNILLGGNLAAAHQLLLQEDLLTKKRNKSSTKSYNNNKGDLIEAHNNSSETAYASQFV